MPLTLKIVLIGNTCVGKTAVLKRLIGELFDPVFIMTTSGESLKRKSMVVNNQQVELELWDAPGNESFRTDVAWYMKNAKAVVVFFDVTNYKSFEDVRNWLKFIPDTDGPSQKPSTFIIGNKTDKKSRCVSREEAEHIAKKRDSPYFETSASENDLEYFDQIFKQIITHVLENSPGYTHSESLNDSQRSVKSEPWYKNCVLL